MWTPGESGRGKEKAKEWGSAPLDLPTLTLAALGDTMGGEGSGTRTLTGTGGPGPSASPPLLSLDEPGLRRGPGEAMGPTPQSPVGLGLCTG